MRRLVWQGMAVILAVGGVAGAAGDSSGVGTQSSVVVNTPERMNLESARVLIDNEQAYRSKLDLIRAARKSIRLAYYIFSDDESSSYLSQLLIEKAAKENVKVDLLVDLNTNFARFDLFRMMEKAGLGNLRVRFYNRPTPAIIRDVTFMTSTCAPEKKADESACRAERKTIADQAFREAQVAAKERRAARLPVMTQIFLAGLYTKSGVSLQQAMALGTGADLADIRAALNSQKGSSSPEDVEQLKALLRLLFQAKVKGSLQAKLQLAAAMSLYGEKIEPIMKMFDKAIPDTMRDQFANEDDWTHVTDFLHHKFLLVDEQRLQIGGRNIENSYQLNNKAGESGKYVFRDTDFAIQLKQPDSRLSQSFDRLFNFSALVTSTADIQTEFKYDFAAQAEQIQQVLERCQKDPSISNKFSCAQHGASALQSQEAARLEVRKKQMETRAASALVKNAISGTTPRFAFFNEALEQKELASAYLGYLENLPYDKNGPTNPTERLYFQDGKEAASQKAKHIHNVVIEGIQRVCGEATKAFSSAKDKQGYLSNPANIRRIAIHQGYTILPAELLAVLGKAVNQTAVNGAGWDMHCPGVRIEILTNSIPTTDLSVINLFAGLQLGSLIDEQQRSQALYQNVEDGLVKSRLFPPAEIRYFEFQAASDQSGQDVESLHTKVFAFDKQGLIIGSANADLRSYYMDSNNGMFIGGAPGLSQQYFQWLDSQKVNDGTGKAYFLDLTEQIRLEAATLARLEAGDAKATESARLAALKIYFQKEAEKIAGHFEKKWRGQINQATSTEELAKIESRIAKMREFLPSAIAAISTINLYVYNVSRDLISQTPTKEQLAEISREFNLRFELL